MLQSPHPRSRGAPSSHPSDGAAVAQTRGTIDRVLAMLEQRGLSPTEVRVLLHLLDREASLVEVATALGHPPSVITRAAGGLDSRGLVRWFHAAHTKESRLAITADGLAAMRALLAAADTAAGKAPPRESHDSVSGANLVLLPGSSPWAVLFGARSTLDACSESYETFRLDALQQRYDVARLLYALKVLLENLIRSDYVLRELT